VFTIVAMAYFLFSAELPSALLRIKTGPVAFFANSILGIATTYATSLMLLSLNIKAAFVFAAFSVPITILMWLYVPETNGRSAAEIDELYERKIVVLRWSKTVTTIEEEIHAVVGKKGSVEEATEP
jgi:SP family general alpha glucoside:H+ symporter-like MFS transporter